MIKQAEILVIKPQSEFIVKANTQSGTALAKVKWQGAFGPEKQLGNTWTIGAIQLNDGKTTKAFGSDDELDSIKKEIDNYLGDCETPINNFLQYKETKSGDRKTIKYVDEFEDDRMYDAGLYNQDLEDQVDTLLSPGTSGLTEGTAMAAIACIGSCEISKDALMILTKAIHTPELNDDKFDWDVKTAANASIDEITTALTNAETTTADEWKQIIVNAINAGFGDSRFDDMSDVDLKQYVDNNVHAMELAPTFESTFPESFDSILEAINFDENEYTNDRSGTNYAAAFDALHKNIMNVKNTAQGIYKHNNVDRDNQISVHLIDNIETFLNKYMAEMEDVESASPSSYIPVLANNVANVINRWVRSIASLDSVVNQHYTTGITGKQVIGAYNTEVYPEMSDVSSMIAKMKFGLNHNDPNKATALITKIANIIKHIDNTHQNFFNNIKEKINTQKEWKSAPKATSGTRQPAMA